MSDNPIKEEDRDSLLSFERAKDIAKSLGSIEKVAEGFQAQNRLIYDLNAQVKELKEKLSIYEWKDIKDAPRDGTPILIKTDLLEDGFCIAKWFKYNGVEAFRDWDGDSHDPELFQYITPPTQEGEE